MGRRERKLQAEIKRHELSIEMNTMLSKTIQSGKSVKEAIDVLHSWVTAKIKESPQEKGMYIEAKLRMKKDTLERAAALHQEKEKVQ